MACIGYSASLAVQSQYNEGLHISVVSGNNILRNLWLYLLLIQEDVTMTGAVFIDLCKAFDSVNHSLLLKKLYALSIVDHEYEWFTDCLKGRLLGVPGSFLRR